MANKTVENKNQEQEQFQRKATEQETKVTSASESEQVVLPENLATGLGTKQTAAGVGIDADKIVSESGLEMNQCDAGFLVSETGKEEGTGKGKEGEWSTVTPGKSACSPTGSKKQLEYGQVSILLGSRFSALEQEEGCSELEKSVTTAENNFSEQKLEDFQEEENQNAYAQVEQKEKLTEAPPHSRKFNTLASRSAHQKAQEINQSILKKWTSQNNL